jgi:uncharacterized protein DUF5518
VSTTTNKPSFGQPALIGGVVMGALSALPLVSAGNLCCCLWVIAGGAIAAYLLQQNTSIPITPGDGAMVGLLAGLVGALVQFAISIPIGIMVAPMERAMMQRVLEMAGTMPPEVRDMIERYSGNEAAMGIGLMVARHVIGLVFWLVVGGIFSTIGGVLGALIFKKDLPPGVIDVPPAQ